MMKRALDLCCAARSVVRREAIPKLGRKLTSSLDCTKVSSRKNISFFALLFYRKGRYDFRCRAQVPQMGTYDFGTVLFCFSISLSETRLNKMRVPRDPVQGSIHARGSA